MVEADGSRIAINKEKEYYNLSYIKEIKALNDYYSHLIKEVNRR
jgi:hypothetical protein